MDNDRGSKPTMGSLFAGIGGFDLGFERAGFKTSWQVEIDPYCQKVLAKNFPEAERFGDIRECCGFDCWAGGERAYEGLAPACIKRHHLSKVDVICGGFPCQDISNAGKRAGIEGERSGLWSEYARIIGELRPLFVLVENVAALLGRGMGVVLGDLAALGYDAEWEIVSAADVGAPHLRERVWIIAYGQADASCAYSDRPGSYREAQHKHRGLELRDEQVCEFGSVGGEVAHSQCVRELQPQGGITNQRGWIGYRRREVAYAGSAGRQELDAAAVAVAERFYSWCSAEGGGESWWAVEPNVGRVAHGVPKRVDRLRGLGNAVVPQIPEMIARRIKEHLR